MLTTVHREISPWDAHIVMGRLRAEGLHPSLLSEHHISLVWPWSMVLGEVRIQVPQAEADHARAVLTDWREGLYQQALEDELGLPNATHCPRCQRVNWVAMRDGWSRALACVMWWFFRSPIFPPEITGRRCWACGYVERFER
jgi:hypothetical protein